MHRTSAPSAHTAKQVAVLRKRALAFPETHEDFPWGHSAFKVKGKAFAFLHADGDGFSISVKLPDSNTLALQLPSVEPTGYGLGKSGWVTARFGRDQDAPLGVLSAWLTESFTAIAPKRVSATIVPEGSAAAQAGASGARAAAKGPRREAALKKGATPASALPAAKSKRAGPRASPIKKRASARAK